MVNLCSLHTRCSARSTCTRQTAQRGAGRRVWAPRGASAWARPVARRRRRHAFQVCAVAAAAAAIAAAAAAVSLPRWRVLPFNDLACARAVSDGLKLRPQAEDIHHLPYSCVLPVSLPLCVVRAGEGEDCWPEDLPSPALHGLRHSSMGSGGTQL